MNLLWCDFETTGIEPDAKLLEVYLDYRPAWNPDAESWFTFHSVINPKIPLDEISRVAFLMHYDNGLLREVVTDGVPAHIVDQQISLELWNQLNRRYGYDMNTTAVKDIRQEHLFRLAGNSVHIDRGWWLHNLPLSGQLLHHRVWEMTTLKHFAEHDGLVVPSAVESHRAKDDVAVSIQQHFTILEKLRR